MEREVFGMRERRKLKTIKEFWCEESGMGTVEIILIIVGISMEKRGCDLSNYRVGLRKIVTV